MIEGRELIVGKWPDRKSTYLSLREGNSTTLLARFQSEQAAEMFLDLARRGIVWKLLEEVTTP